MAVHKKYNNGTKSNALGRGLDALISTEGVRTQGSSTINEIPLDQIEANPNQPRREFDDEALHELAESIKAIGIIQPITLRQVAENRFQIKQRILCNLHARRQAKIFPFKKRLSVQLVAHDIQHGIPFDQAKRCGVSFSLSLVVHPKRFRILNS